MGDYFKPWRRKIGVMTLLIACVLAAGWVKSAAFNDLIIFPIGQDLRFGVVSNRGRIALVRHDWHENAPTLRTYWFSASFAEHPDAVFILDHEELQWLLRLGAFGIRQRLTSSFTVSLIQLPYWSIVIPLTLLSAWLLLSKPRTKTTPEKQPSTI